MKVSIVTNVMEDLIGSRLTLSLPNKSSLSNLFNQLIKKYGAEIEKRLFKMGKLKSNLTILINGHPLANSDLEKELPQPCEICIIQMLSGG